jgi:arylsulfatase A-like enzyme
MGFATGYPGYHSEISRSVGMMVEVLRQNGYGSAWFGKTQNVPDWQASQAGPTVLRLIRDRHRARAAPPGRAAGPGRARHEPW